MGMATKYQIFLGYTIFLALYFTISQGIGYSIITGAQPNFGEGFACDTGYTIVDRAINCFFAQLANFGKLFNLSSSIGLFNVIILFPYFAFLFLLAISLVRGVD